ncbi:cell pole-organizing protein PopZ [Hymenobacter sp. UYAg731]
MKTPDDIIHPDGSITRFKPTAYTLLSQLGPTYASMQKMAEAAATVRKFVEADAKMQKIIAPMLKANRQHEALFFTREVIPPPTGPAAESGPSPVPMVLPTHTLAHVGTPVAASSPDRLALAATPTQTLPAAPPAPVVSASSAQPAPVPSATPNPAAEQLPRLAKLLTSRFTLPQLKKWLAEVGLIDPETGTAKPNAKPYEWAAAREALYKAGLLGQLSSEQAADVFSEAFSTTVSAGTMKNRDNAKADKKGKFYQTFTHYKALLGDFLTR